MSDELKVWLVVEASTTKPHGIPLEPRAMVIMGHSAENAAQRFMDCSPKADACAVVLYESPRYFVARLAVEESKP